MINKIKNSINNHPKPYEKNTIDYQCFKVIHFISHIRGIKREGYRGIGENSIEL